MNQQPAIRCSSQFPPRPTIHKMKSQAGVGQRMPTNPHVLRWFILEKKKPNIVLMNVSNMTYIYIIIIINNNNPHDGFICHHYFGLGSCYIHNLPRSFGQSHCRCDMFKQHMKAASDINTGCNHILGDCMF